MKKTKNIFKSLIAFVLSLFLVNIINITANLEPVIVDVVFIDHKTNVPEGDITSMFGLDEDIFKVYQLNHDAGTRMWMTKDEVRLYSVRSTGEGTELVFEVNEGYEILSVEFTIKASDSPDAEVFVDKVSHNVYSNYGTEITIDELSASSVSIKNVFVDLTGTKNEQLHITGIKITYHEEVEELGLVESIDGASIRSEGIQGLRFYAKVLDATNIKVKGFYLMFGEATVSDLIKALNNPEVGGYHQHKGKDVIEVIVPGVTHKNEYSVVLTGIPVKGYLDNITVIAFAENKENKVEYGIPVTRSIGEVAIKLDETLEEEMPAGIEAALSEFTKVRFTGNNLEVSKGLKDSLLNYVNLDLYKIYHPEIEEIILPDFDGNENFKGWYKDSTFTIGPITTIDPSDITEDIILYPKWEAVKTTVTLEYPGGTTTNMTGNNDAEIVGLDPLIFTVKSNKNGGSNHIGLNTAGRIQIYQTGNGAILTVLIAEEYLITEIKIKFLKTGSGADAKITLGELVAPNTTANDITNKTVTFSDLEIALFSIQNVHPSNVQLWIKNIEITYKLAIIDEPLDTTPPVITFNEPITSYAVGETFSLSEALSFVTAIDDKDGEVLVNLDYSSLSVYLDLNDKFTTSGTYELIYSASDSAGNISYKSLFITVEIKHNVTFLLDIDEELKTVKVKEGETVTPEELDLKEGYQFIGWFYEGDLFDFETLIITDITLIARWNREVYSLTLSNGLESDQFNNDVVLYDSLVTLTVHVVEGLFVEKLTVNGIDVTEEIINNEYSFILKGNTTAILVYDYLVTETVLKSKEKVTTSIATGSETDIKSYLTTTDENISVIYKKNNAGTHSIFNNEAKEIRLYPGSENGGSLVISVSEGYEIVRVLIDIASDNSGFSINGSGNYTYSSSSQTIELFNPLSSVEIKNIANATTGNRVDINSITVMYKEISEIVIDISPPVIKLNENVSLIFSYEDVFNYEEALTWVSVIDNVDEFIDLMILLDYSELMLDDNDYFIESGSFTLFYTAEDTTGNIGYLSIIIRVYESLEVMLASIDYSEISYYEILNIIEDDISLIEQMAYLLRDTISYQTYDQAKYLYAYYDNGKQVVFYDYEGRDGYKIDGTYENIPDAWGDGGYVTLSNGKTVKLEREHVWACSDMLIKPANENKRNTEYVGYLLNLDKEFDYRPNNDHKGHYSDLHNLWLSIGSANGTHSNNFYGEENGPSDAYYLANSIFYPGIEYVGDIARILFYMTLMYPHLTLVNQDDPNAGVTNNIYYGYLDVLLYWNEIDPPSEYEIARNESIYQTQGNRNPFIDFYEQGFAEGVFFNGDPEVADKIEN